MQPVRDHAVFFSAIISRPFVRLFEDLDLLRGEVDALSAGCLVGDDSLHIVTFHPEPKSTACQRQYLNQEKMLSTGCQRQGCSVNIGR